MTLLIISFCLWAGLLAIMKLDQMRSRKRWRSLWRRLGLPTQEDQIELALRDFVVAYDDQIPEQLLGAYHKAVAALPGQ